MLAGRWTRAAAMNWCFKAGPARCTMAATMNKLPSDPDAPASTNIDTRIAQLPDWRGRLLARLRALIRAADPGIVEEWKWNTPVWSCEGVICTGETYKQAVKLTFMSGAALADPARLFNASLDGKTRRAIDFHEGDAVNEAALQELVRAAAHVNRAARRGPGPRR